MTAQFVIEALTDEHNRKAFSCGNEPLDLYFQQQAEYDVSHRVAQCFIARQAGGRRVVGFYTLSAGHVIVQDMPDAVARKLPRYPIVPIARVGRLAIDRTFQGQGLGSALLWDATSRSLMAQVGIFALAVEAADEQAGFYRHHGFSALPSAPEKLFLPLAAGVSA